MAGLPIVDDDAETGNEKQILTESHLSGKCGSEALETHSNIVAEKESLPADIPAYIMKCKSVFKCRICPRIICLNEETLRAHLNSKVRCLAYFFHSSPKIQIIVYNSSPTNHPMI